MSIAEYSGYIVQYCMIRNIYVMVYLRHDGIWPTVPLVRFNVIENMTNYCGQVRHQNRTDNLVPQIHPCSSIPIENVNVRKIKLKMVVLSNTENGVYGNAEKMILINNQ